MSPEPGRGQGPAMGWLDGKAHVYPVRVYYEDTDAGAIVYHANYLRFMERARNEFLRLLGRPHARMVAEDGVAFAVRHCEIDFRQSARLDDALEVVTTIPDIGAATLDAVQTVRRAGPSAESPELPGGSDLVVARLRLACINQNGRPVRLPKPLRTVLMEFLARPDQD